MTAGAVLNGFSQPHFHFHQLRHTVFTQRTVLYKTAFGMQIERTPGAIFTDQLLANNIACISGGIAAISASPVWRNVPVGTLTAITGGYFSLGGCSWIQLADQFGTFPRKIFGDLTFILQTP